MSVLDFVWQTIIDNKLGDLASVLGLFISFGGFWWTIVTARTARKAAEEAKAEMVEVQRHIARFDAATELSAAHSAMEEIKELHRDGEWRPVLRRYPRLRQSIRALRESVRELSVGQRNVLRDIIEQLSTMEKRIERTLQGAEAPEISRINETLSKMQDSLNEIVTNIRAQIGR